MAFDGIVTKAVISELNKVLIGAKVNKVLEPNKNEVVLEAPAGIIRTTAIVKDGKVESVTLTNVPAFVYKENERST